MSEYCTTLYKSFRYIRKRRGPSTDPWGTPFLVGKISEDVLLTSVNCMRSSKEL